MQERRYLLHLGAFGSSRGDEAYYHRALGLLDSERRDKAMCQREGLPRAASIGAGLLLQLAMQSQPSGKQEPALPGIAPEITRGKDFGITRGKSFGITPVSLEDLLDLLQEPVELSYCYGENGKPYLEGNPFYFNLSHSGEYVLCALSGGEIGTDIQRHQASPKEAFVKRFFSEREQELFACCKTPQESEELFFRLWTRKEAYGKLTGRGLAAVVAKDVYRQVELHSREKLQWEEYSQPEGYHICVCRYKEKERI